MEEVQLPPGTKLLSHQVAGHMPSDDNKQSFGFLQCEDGTLLKVLQGPPRGLRELNFYENVFNPETKDPVLLELRNLLPVFHGLVVFPKSDTQYIRLEDVALRYSKPCILDIKMGPKTYDPDATPEKIASEKAKYPPLEKVGFQLRGMRVYMYSKNQFDVYGKDYLRSLSEDELATKGLGVFFNNGQGLRKDIISVMLEKLRMIQHWFESQKHYHFYASSLLVVYEGHQDPLEHFLNEEQNHVKNNTGLLDKDCSTADNTSSLPISCQSMNRELADIRLIDFAHVFEASNRDDNYLYGLNSLLKYFESLLK